MGSLSTARSSNSDTEYDAEDILLFLENVEIWVSTAIKGKPFQMALQVQWTMILDLQNAR